MCCIFGFMRECLEKYDDMTFSMFIEVFRYLPLATTINSQVGRRAWLLAAVLG